MKLTILLVATASLPVVGEGNSMMMALKVVAHNLGISNHFLSAQYTSVVLLLRRQCGFGERVWRLVPVQRVL